MKLESINPATEEIVGSVEVSSKDDVLNAVSKARKAFAMWKNTPVSERAKLMKTLKSVVEKHKSELIELVTKEMGKPIEGAKSEMSDIPADMDSFVEDAKKYLQLERVDMGDEKIKGEINFEPLGVAGLITPWNYPAAIPLEGTVPMLMAGNTVVFKHSENTCLMGQKMEEMFKEAGFPEGVFNVVHGAGDIGKILIESPVNLIMFTGSAATGKKIAEAAGRDLKKVVLELGGSDAFIVLEDMDAKEMGKNAATARYRNCGQICVSPKRFFVHESIAQEFTDSVVNAAKELKVGNPMDESTEMGPLVNKGQLEMIESQVNDSVSAGANLLTGGKRINGKGYFYEPTVFADVKPEMRVLKEETFGPVAVIDTFNSDEEVIEKANNTIYGLGGSVWTKDIERGRKIALKLDTGMVAINSTPGMYPNLPWNGKKSSGLGRARSKYGFMELVHTKPIVITEK